MIRIIVLLVFYVFLSISFAQESIDMIIVEKSLRVLNVLKNGKIVRKYTINLGFDPIGHKYFKGDGKTPEGLYFISKKSTNSDFYIALQISYPNKWDNKNAKTFNKNAGNYIMIHGQPNIIRTNKSNKDWTNGCIALQNKDIKELYKYVSINTPIYIKP